MDYETELNFYFIGPDDVSEEEFNRVCKTLLPEAVDKAIKAKGNYQGSVTLEIGWGVIIEFLAYDLLPKQGYDPYTPKTAKFNGPGIIWDEIDRGKLTEESLDKILQFNKELSDKRNTKT
jgi:hypothetical protein